MAATTADESCGGEGSPVPPQELTAGTAAERLSVAAQTEISRVVMRKQAALSIRIAAVFLVLVLGLPLVNHLMPEAAGTPTIGGFTRTWLFLGVLFYPITWFLSGYFIRASDKLERECADIARTRIAAENNMENSGR